MSVVFMLAIIWWAICGFLAFIVGVWGFMGSIGPIGRGIVFVILGFLGQHLLVNYIEAEENAAKGFITAWQAESNEYPDGRMYSHSFGEFVDYDRFGPVNPYLALHWRMRHHSPVREAGKEKIIPKGSETPVQTEVFLSDVKIHGSEHDVDFRTTLRVWVATDNNKIVQFLFEEIVFL